MKDQTNTALVQKLYAAFAKGDVQTILDHCTDDIEWNMEGPAIIPYSGKRRGTAQVLQFFHALATTQSNQKLTTEIFVEQGDHVATLGRYTGTVTATGKPFDGPVAHFFTIRDGKVSRFVDVGETADMAAAYTASSAAGSSR
jgi:ketosteroid isomerase-like protein